LAQISIKKCAGISSDSALKSSSAGKLVSMKLCVSNIVIEAFSKEEGNVTTEKYHGGQFRKIVQANQFLDLKQASM
jgi:predicted small secreted protein